MAYVSQKIPLMWNRTQLRKIITMMDAALASGGLKGDKGDPGKDGEVSKKDFDALVARVATLEKK